MSPDAAIGDLLSWEPPVVETQSFPEPLVRAAGWRARIAKAVSLALRECEVKRERIAQAMSEYLGETVSLNMLNAYASEAREDHNISVERFLALAHATRDQRLLQLLVEPFGLALVEKRFVPAIQQVLIDEQIKRLQEQSEIAKRQWKSPR